jgi:predicted DNA-binding transcriptional regulator YafY
MSLFTIQRVLMSFETSGRKEVIRWVLSWMPDVKVLAPKNLRERIVEKLQDGLTKQVSNTTQAAITTSPRGS